MDYGKAAREVLQCVGGKDNVISAAHCATRLRLVIADNSKCDKAKLENVDGVKGAFEASGQLQVIFGTGTVNKVFAEFAPLAGIDVNATKDDVKQAAASKQNIFLRAIKSLGDIFVPIIPAIVASGLLMGLLEGFNNAFPSLSKSDMYTVIHLFSNAAFVFLPILIAISAAKTFGGNLFLGAVMGMIMVHPDLMNAWSVAGADSVPTAEAWFGLYQIDLVGYQGHVIPIVIAVWLMSTLEKWLHKHVPEIIDLFVTPLVTVLVTGYVTLTIVGPIFVVIENAVLGGAKALITLPFGIGSAIVGAFYAPTVVAGLHHMYNAIEAGLIAADGKNIWMPIATAANVAQGAAALALAIKTKDKKAKSVALPASLSAFLGITEPAIFGVNLRYVKPFVAGIVGGCVGGLVAGITGVWASAYGITGVFGFLITTNNTMGYLLVMLVAAGVGFAVSWMLYKDEEKEAPAGSVGAGSEKSFAEPSAMGEVFSPLSGEAIAMEDVPDDTFAAKVLGDGMAVVPSEGKVYAPFDGTVDMVYDTKHALGLSQGDMEMLIHVGINTVELEGKFFTAHVSNGQSVKKGDLLLEFDMNGIKNAGYNLTTPVIITNSDDYENLWKKETGAIRHGELLMKV